MGWLTGLNMMNVLLLRSFCVSLRTTLLIHTTTSWILAARLEMRLQLYRFAWFYTPVAVEVIGTPDFNDLEGRPDTFEHSLAVGAGGQKSLFSAWNKS